MNKNTPMSEFLSLVNSHVDGLRDPVTLPELASYAEMRADSQPLRLEADPAPKTLGEAGFHDGLRFNVNNGSLNPHRKHRVKVGDIFSVSLRGNRSTGEDYSATPKDSCIVLVSEKYVADYPDLSGSPGEWRFMFKAVAPVDETKVAFACTFRGHASEAWKMPIEITE